METNIAIFKGKEIRKTIHKNEWWFVIVDVVSALTGSVDPSGYIKDMRRRDVELHQRVGANCHPLSILTEGGAQKMNCANTNPSSGSFGLFPLLKQNHSCDGWQR